MGDKVCLNHTSIQATSRCTTCFKPICDSCIKAEGEEHFCSQICIEKHKITSENIQHLKQRRKSTLPATMIKLIIILAVAYAVWTYKDKIKEIFDKGKKEISK